MHPAASLQEIRGFLQSFPTALLVHREGRILFANDAMARLALVGCSTQILDVELDRLFPDGAPGDGDTVLLRRAGDAGVSVEVAASLVSWGGAPAHRVVCRVDPRAEALARDGRFRDLADQAPVMIGETDAHGHVTFLNRTWLEFRGRTLEEEEGWAWAAGLHPDDRARAIEAMAAAIGRREPYSIEYRIEDRHGVYHWLLDSGVPRRDRDGQLLGYVGTAVDISQLKAVEGRLQTELAEKEVLLREVHHRVKNNLQIVSSLLHFQAKKVSDPLALAAFAESRERLRSMVLVHEHLYGSSRLADVDFGAYLGALVREIQGGQPAERRISVHLELAAEIGLPIEVALPGGMIVCELLMNVYKYAFPGPSRGAAWILLAVEGGRVLLRIRDDGVGLPPGVDPRESGGFGWQLIRSLCAQLDGEVTLTDGAPGVEVTLAFPRPIVEPPAGLPSARARPASSAPEREATGAGAGAPGK